MYLGPSCNGLKVSSEARCVPAYKVFVTGFLDGADRTMMLASSNPSSPAEMEPYLETSSSPTSLSHCTSKQWSVSLAPSAKLLVSNLPTLLFAQASDLHPLFYPFGPIKDVKLLDPAVLGSGTTSALVEYVDISNAQEAKDALQRQLYGSSYLEVRFIQDNIHSVECSATAYAQSPVLPKVPDAKLNPFATPFVYHQPSLLSDTFQISSIASHPAMYHFRTCVADAISRSSSATSSR